MLEMMNTTDVCCGPKPSTRSAQSANTVTHDVNAIANANCVRIKRPSTGEPSDARISANVGAVFTAPQSATVGARLQDLAGKKPYVQATQDYHDVVTLQDVGTGQELQETMRVHDIVCDSPTTALLNSLGENGERKLGNLNLSSLAIQQRFNAHGRKHSLPSADVRDGDVYLEEDIPWHLSKAGFIVKVEDDVIDLKLILAFDP